MHGRSIFIVSWLLSILGTGFCLGNEPSEARPPDAQTVIAWHQAVVHSGKIDFANDVVPILTKAGCNSGVCHAKAGGGQNGFELSLLGFDPEFDYQQIVTQGRGRRVFPAAPEQSLLVLKALGNTPHRGGVRLQEGSPQHQLLVRWIEQGYQLEPTAESSENSSGASQDATTATGSAYSSTSGATASKKRLAEVTVLPQSLLMQPGHVHQLQVLASFTDGSTRDVTDLALFESNNSNVVSVDDRGAITAGDLPGTAAIMVRYQGFVCVSRPAVPLGKALDQLPEFRTLVDQELFGNLQRLGIAPSAACDDATFLRRVAIDLVGRLPTQDEQQRYWQWSSDSRRQQLVDDLLLHPDYADYFANKWTSLLKNRREDSNDLAANFAFHAWIRDQLLSGTPYDQMVRSLLAATGTIMTNPAVAWYKRVKDPKEQLEDISQLFLGVRLQCAQCHHHPFERWSQDDYYSLAACFSRVGRKPTGKQNEDMIFHQRGVAEAINVRSGQKLPPRALGTDLGPLEPSDDPRLKLADWMRQANNPFFARALVNRYWKHFFHIGLIEPEDDIRDTNPASNPDLLASLERHFVENGFDLRDLVKTIVLSTAYQLSSLPNEHNLVDTQNYSRFYPRRLTAEVLLDSIDQLVGAQTSFANLPPGTRAIALPDNSYNRSVPFLKVFGRPENASVCECERIQSANLSQSLYLLNAADIKAKLSAAGGLAERLAQSEQPLAERVEQIYKLAYSRSPKADELTVILDFFAAEKPTKAEFEDLLWAIVNSKEFLFNH